MLHFEFDVTGLDADRFAKLLECISNTLAAPDISGVNSQAFLDFGPGALRLEHLNIMATGPRTSLNVFCTVDVSGHADALHFPIGKGDNKYIEPAKLERVDYSPIAEYLDEPETSLVNHQFLEHYKKEHGLQ